MFRTVGPIVVIGSPADPWPLRSGRELALFGRGLLRVQFYHNSFPVKHLPFVSFRSDWRLFRTFCGLAASALAALHGPRPRVPAHRELASFGTLVPSDGRACGLGRRALLPAGADQLGSFGAIVVPGDGSAGASPAAPSSCPRRELAFVCTRSCPTTAPSVTCRPSVPSLHADVGRIGFRFARHSFGVPRLRGSDRSFPPQGGTGQSERPVPSSTVAISAAVAAPTMDSSGPVSMRLHCYVGDQSPRRNALGEAVLLTMRMVSGVNLSCRPFIFMSCSVAYHILMALIPSSSELSQSKRCGALAITSPCTAPAARLTGLRPGWYNQ